MNTPNALGTPAPNADYLAESAEYIRENLKNAVMAVYRAGERLAQVRDMLKASGGYIRWLTDDVCISHDTASNYINVFERIGALSSVEAPKIALGALYAIVAPTADEQGREEALAVLAEGGSLNHKQAYIYARAPEYIRRAMESKTLSVDDAHATTKALNRPTLHPEVKQLCLTHGVHYADAVNWLNEKHAQALKTAHTSRPSGTYEDVAGNGWLNMQDGGVSLMYARQADIEKYMKERTAFVKYEAVEARYSWKRAKVRVVIDGDVPMLDLSGVEGTFSAGDFLLVDIRLPIQGD